MDVVHSLCNSYHWSYTDAMKRTVPQIIMLNYSAWRESKNAEIKAKAKSEWDKREDEDPVLPEYGIRRSELGENPSFWEHYYTNEID